MKPASHSTEVDPELAPLSPAEQGRQQRCQQPWTARAWDIYAFCLCSFIGFVLLCGVGAHHFSLLGDRLGHAQKETLTRDSKAYPEFLKV